MTQVAKRQAAPKYGVVIHEYYGYSPYWNR